VKAAEGNRSKGPFGFLESRIAIAPSNCATETQLFAPFWLRLLVRHTTVATSEVRITEFYSICLSSCMKWFKKQRVSTSGNAARCARSKASV